MTSHLSATHRPQISTASQRDWPYISVSMMSRCMADSNWPSVKKISDPGSKPGTVRYINAPVTPWKATATYAVGEEWGLTRALMIRTISREDMTVRHLSSAREQI